MSKYEKGARRERELVKELEKRGFRAMRAPSSGSTTDRELPDVLAGNGERFYAIEVKASSEDKKYIPKEEVKDLETFADAFGAEALIGMRFDYEEFAFFKKEELHSTDKNYRVDRVKVPEAQSLEELL